MRAILFETMTGNPIVESMEFVTCKTDTGILAADKVTIRVPEYTPVAGTLDLRKLLLPMRVGVAVQDDDGRVPAAGILTADPVASEDEDGNNGYDLTCYGPQKLMADWFVRMFPGWPLVNGDGIPTGAFDTRIEGVEYGTMMKRLIVEAMKFPGGDLPLVFEPDRIGTRQKGWEAIDGKSVLSAIDDIADLINGVEYEFVPRVADDFSVSWEFVTATDAVREISRPSSAVWRLGGDYPDLRGYERTTSADELVTEATFSGGKDEDRVLLARSLNAELVAAGFPRREEWDSSHSSVSDLSTLQGWADQAAAIGAGFIETLKFEVRAELAVGLRHGDWCQIESLDHWDMPDGVYDRRIISVGRDADSDWVAISCIGEVVSG